MNAIFLNQFFFAMCLEICQSALYYVMCLIILYVPKLRERNCLYLVLANVKLCVFVINGGKGCQIRQTGILKGKAEFHTLPKRY